jgi:hypothetical protein
VVSCRVSHGSNGRSETQDRTGHFQLIDVDLLWVVEEAATVSVCGQQDDTVRPQLLTMKSDAFVRSVACIVGKRVAGGQVADGRLPGVVGSYGWSASNRGRAAVSGVMWMRI